MFLPAPLILALFVACGEPADPLASLDTRYTEIMVDIGVADRDTARNVRNKEARQRKVAAEKERVALFRDKGVIAQIEAAAAEADTPIEKVKAEAYGRHLLMAGSWTEDEKAEETRLLGRLDEAASREASWTSRDGETTIPLGEGWSTVSRQVDELTQEERDDLARQYVDHRMGQVGQDLQDLVRVRNAVAQRAGFASYWEMALSAHELEPKEVDALISELSLVVSPSHAAFGKRIAMAAKERGIPDTFANRPLLRRAAGLETGRDEADAWFDTDLAEERVMTAYQDMGISTEGWQIHTGPARYVRPGVYGFPIRPPDYVAIVMSQDTRWSVWQYEALAHEGGHAYWWNSLAKDVVGSPVLWEPAAPWFEGFAHFFERLTYEPGWTARYVPELPMEDRAPLQHWRARHVAEWISDAIVETLVERRLYEDPSNLEAVTHFAAETRQRLTGEPAAPMTEKGLTYDSALLSSIMWNYPAYSQNFLYAYMTEAWLYAGVEDQVGDPVANAKVGQLLREKIIRAPPEVPFADRLAALHPGKRTDALKAYLELPEAPTPTP